MSYELLVNYQAETGQISIITVEDEQVPQDLIQWGWDHFAQCPIYASPKTPFPANQKFDTHRNHRRKTAFESELALLVFENTSLFLPLLRKLSQTISHYLEKKYQQASPEEKIIIGDILTEYLYTDIPHFGRLGLSTENDDPNVSYEQAQTILKSGDKIEHLLTTFMAIDTAFETLVEEQKAEPDTVYLQRTTLKSQLVSGNLFKNRDRTEENNTLTLSTKFGITDDAFDLSYKLPAHTRPIEKLEHNFLKESDFTRDAYRREIPLVSGPSGHTVKLLLAVLPLTNICDEELKQFMLVSASFLIAAGAHSFHEVYTVAKKVDVPYNIGRYEDPIPDLLIRTPAYAQLTKKYPDIIKSDAHTLTPPTEQKPSSVSLHKAGLFYKHKPPLNLQKEYFNKLTTAQEKASPTIVKNTSNLEVTNSTPTP